ncbi:hypothetical protein ACP4OV_017219 [Aristida adscensionis]
MAGGDDAYYYLDRMMRQLEYEIRNYDDLLTEPHEEPDDQPEQQHADPVAVFDEDEDDLFPVQRRPRAVESEAAIAAGRALLLPDLPGRRGAVAGGVEADGVVRARVPRRVRGGVAVAEPEVPSVPAPRGQGGRVVPLPGHRRGHAGDDPRRG